MYKFYGIFDPEIKAEAFHEEHGEKVQKKQGLKKQIQSTKERLEKMKNDIPEEKMESYNTLSNKYNGTREEYNAMHVAEKSSE